MGCLRPMQLSTVAQWCWWHQGQGDMDRAGIPVPPELLLPGLWLVPGNAASSTQPWPRFGDGQSSRSNSCYDSLFPFPFPDSSDFPWQLWCCWGCVYRQLKLINWAEATEAPRQRVGVSRAGERATPGCPWHIQGGVGSKQGSAPTWGDARAELGLEGSWSWQQSLGDGRRAWALRWVSPTQQPHVDVNPGAECCQHQTLSIGKGVKHPAASSLGGCQPRLPSYSPAICHGDEISSALGRQEPSEGLLKALARMCLSRAGAGRYQTAAPELPRLGKTIAFGSRGRKTFS